MRALLVLFLNALIALRLLLGLPFRWMASRRRPSWVRFVLSGDPPYRAPRKRRMLLGKKPPPPGTVTSLFQFERALEVLAKDARVHGVVLVVDSLALPPAKRQVLTAALERFRAAGKKIVAWTVSVENAGYELVCAADQVLLAPAGRIDITGFAAEATAMGEGLARIGIHAHFVRRGDYKTAPELFTHGRVSDIQRATIERLLDERYAELVTIVSTRRALTEEEVRARIDEGPYSARRALERRLVDGLVSESDLPEWLAERFPQSAVAPEREAKGEEEPKKPRSRMAIYPEYLATLPLPPDRFLRVRPLPRVAVVPVNGMIAPGEGGKGPVGPQLAGSEALTRVLRKAARDPRSKAVVLYISSPGGSALASELILEAVKRVATKKPVIAYVDRVAASGGYMAALGAREIWSAPQAIVGSIGVFAGKFEASELLERVGIHRTVITRGRNAGLFSTSRPFTESERASLEAEVEETYQTFLKLVAEARKSTPDVIHLKAEGRIYSGRAALEAGLVDALGTFEEACRRALSLAEISAERFDLQVHLPTTPRSALIRLLQEGARAQVYALTWPLWSVPGLEGAEAFGEGAEK